MKVLLTGITGLRNRGVEALVTVIAHEVGRWGGVALSALTLTPDYDRAVGPADVAFVLDEVRRPSGRGGDQRRRLSRRLAAADRPYRRSVDRITAVDAVVATGGDVFSSDYGGLSRHLEPLRIAKAAGVPYALLAQSIGPFKTDGERTAFLDVARSAAHLSVREQISYDYLTHDLHLAPESVLLTHDPAFRLPVPPEAEVDALLERYGIDPSRPYAVVSPSRGITRYAGTSELNAHRLAWRESIEQLRDLGAQVVVVPHVQDVDPNNDDRLYSTAIVSALADPSGVRFAGANESARTFKGLVSRADLTVTERMHAAVAALSTGRPVVPVSYSIKTPGVLRGFAGTALGDRLTMEFRSFLSAAERRKHIATIWDDREAIATILSGAAPSARRSAEQAFEALRLSIVRSNA